jgi:hypothetical protein
MIAVVLAVFAAHERAVCPRFVSRHRAVIVGVSAFKHLGYQRVKLDTGDCTIGVVIEPLKDPLAPPLHSGHQVRINFIRRDEAVTVAIEALKARGRHRVDFIAGNRVIGVGVQPVEHSTSPMATGSIDASGKNGHKGNQADGKFDGKFDRTHDLAPE